MVGEVLLRKRIYIKNYLVITWTYIFVFFDQKKSKLCKKTVIYEARK